MNGAADIGSFVKLWTVAGEAWGVQADEEPRIDAAVSQWIDSGETRDTLLLLTLIGGDSFKIRASSVASWMVSTSEGRRGEWEIEKAGDEERKRIRQELGIWEDGD